MVLLFLCRATKSLSRSAESPESTTVLLKVNSPPLLISSTTSECSLMVNLFKDKSSLSEDFNLPNKKLLLAEEPEAEKSNKS